jgi:TorA maturation chaperone TorD
MSEAKVSFRPFVSPEDQARADFYALLARLFADAPDANLLAMIASASPLATEDVGAPLAQAWSDLIATATAADADAFREEYDRLFVGMGKAPLNLHASHHLTGFMMEQPLADVRESLKALGLERLASAGHVEDHLASLLETMRILIVGTDDWHAKSITVQTKFFQDHIAAWVNRCFEQIMKSPLANMYIPIGQLGKCFLALEREQFGLEA